MIATPVPTNLPCYLVNNLTYSAEQCKFIIDNDCLEEESVIDYVYLVYCELGTEMRILSIAIIISLVIILFLALSAVADEFLCPVTLTAAKCLGMSDSLAGVTLLAFGNGCPDIFSSIAAASSDRSELIVGELLGAGIFCTSIVSGLIFIHSDFKLACRPLLRDTTFYLLAVYLIWYYCFDEKVTFYGSLSFIFIYVIYLIVALVGQAINYRLRGNYPITDTQEIIDTGELESSENWFKWREESLRRKMAARKEREIETASIASNQQNANLSRLNAKVNDISNLEQTAVELELYPGSLPCSSSTPSSSLGRCDLGDGSYLNPSCCDNNDELASKFSERTTCRASTPEKLPDQLQSVQYTSDLAKPNVGCSKTNQPIESYKSRLSVNEWDDFLTHINPIELANWYESGICGRIISVLRAPLLFLSILTVPVVDYERRRNNWCRFLNALHGLSIPLAISLSFKPGTDDCFIKALGVPLPIIVMIPGLILAILILKTSKADEPPTYHVVFAFIGFFMSIAWIFILATEIISLLKTVGVMFSMSDTAIGLGILAWGNSLGDIVANMSLAEAGYPRMALGASIGAPLLNLLLGFGLSFTINMKPGEFSTIEYSPTITLLCSTLIIILVALMFSTLVNPARSKKPFGYALIASYCVYLFLAVCLEYQVIKF